jgi:hypothetical protein
MKIEVKEEAKLRWPDGWPRTLVTAWKANSSWRKSKSEYQTSLIKELQLLGAVSVLITTSENERTDPGVAVWFSMEKSKEDWQGTLGLESPAPTFAEIDSAFREKAKEVHPDRTDGKGDVAVYQKLVAARTAAKEWIRGTHDKQHDFVMALDLFKETRHNIHGIKLAIASLRSLKRLGMPSILERTLNKAFKASLEATTGGANGEPTQSQKSG